MSSWWKTPPGRSHAFQSSEAGKCLGTVGYCGTEHQMKVSVKPPFSALRDVGNLGCGVGFVALCHASHLEVPWDGDQFGLVCFQNLTEVNLFSPICP